MQSLRLGNIYKTINKQCFIGILLHWRQVVKQQFSVWSLWQELECAEVWYQHRGGWPASLQTRPAAAGGDGGLHTQWLHPAAVNWCVWEPFLQRFLLSAVRVMCAAAGVHTAETHAGRVSLLFQHHWVCVRWRVACLACVYSLYVLLSHPGPLISWQIGKHWHQGNICNQHISFYHLACTGDINWHIRLCSHLFLSDIISHTKQKCNIEHICPCMESYVWMSVTYHHMIHVLWIYEVTGWWCRWNNHSNSS